MDKSRHHIIGTGRWGTWLARRLHATGFELGSVRNRTVSSAERLAAELDVEWKSTRLSESGFHAKDIIWCCVPDAEIVKIRSQLNELNQALQIVHCSGTSPLLKGDTTGVFWPVQSITAQTEPDWSNLPIVVQASTPAFAKTLLEIAKKVSELPPKLVSSDENRMRLHLGAVMTQNFTNLLWTLTQKVFKDADLDYKDLLPLAKNHLEKLVGQTPDHLQTGPASRGDENTIKAHLALLDAHPQAKETYLLLSEHIAKKEH